MRLIVGVCALVAFAGCGVLDDAGPATQATPDPAVYGPARASGDQSAAAIPIPPRLRVSRGVARSLDAGVIGVVDVTGAVTIEPAALDTASDARVQGLRWSRWGADGAAGSGLVRILTCEPTCVAGGFDELPARIELTGVTECDGRRYFARGVVIAEGRRPASYVRAPC